MQPPAIVVAGVESTGKTTLARRLAAATGRVFVPDVARAWLNARGGRYEESDLLTLARLRTSWSVSANVGVELWSPIRLSRSSGSGARCATAAVPRKSSPCSMPGDPLCISCPFPICHGSPILCEKRHLWMRGVHFMRDMSDCSMNWVIPGRLYTAREERAG